MINACKKLFWSIITVQCRDKFLLKLDDWSMLVKNYCKTWELSGFGTSWCRRFRIYGCGFKMILKIDNWSKRIKKVLKLFNWFMRLESFFETWKLIYGGSKWFWDMVIDPLQYNFFLNFIIDRCEYKKVLKLDNWWKRVWN